MSAPIWTKFDSWIENNMRITAKWSRSKPEVEFQYGGCLFFSKTEVVISQPSVENLRYVDEILFADSL